MQDWSVWLQIATFDVEHSPVARFHNHGNPVYACLLAHQKLHLEVVTLVDQDIDLWWARQESRQGILGHPFPEDFYLRIRIRFIDLTRCNNCFVDADLVYPRVE